jgi:hypothetical protein
MIFGLEIDVAICLDASAVGFIVELTIPGFPTGGAMCVAVSILDAAEQPDSMVATRKMVNRYLILTSHPQLQSTPNHLNAQQCGYNGFIRGSVWLPSPTSSYSKLFKRETRYGRKRQQEG